MDCGDNIVVVNAEKVQLTGNKRADDIFYWHTGYPGGIKGRSKGAILDGKHPERVIRRRSSAWCRAARSAAGSWAICGSMPDPSIRTTRSSRTGSMSPR